MGDEKITGGAGRIRLGGKFYLVGQPTDSDMGSISVFVQKRQRTPLTRLTSDPGWTKLSQSQQDRLLEKVPDPSKAAPTSAEEMLGVLTSVDGCRFLAYLLIRKQQPEVSPEEIHAAINEANAELVFLDLDEASGMSNLGNGAGQPGSVPAATDGNSTKS